ncbi:unnamed protein product [Orchesella dallaii]|uniref:Uncharacterized protein n=1 Tax=Orchesella dallaii TaxID=48710 RepID=A0ABP1RWV1_9HEXA
MHQKVAGLSNNISLLFQQQIRQQQVHFIQPSVRRILNLSKMKAVISTLVGITFLCVIQHTLGANILLFNAVGTHSTRISMTPYMEALANKGHKITFLSPYESNDPQKHPNITDYIPKKWQAAMGPWEEHIRFYDVRKNKEMVKSWFELKNLGLAACTMLYTDPDYVEWMKSSKFDIVIVECIVNECGYGLAHFFNAKLVIYSTTLAWSSYIDAHGLPDESGSVTDLVYNFPPGNQMSFWQRFVNALNPVVYTIMRHRSYFPALEEITKTGLQVEEFASFAEIEKNASLILLTTHFSMDYPRSFPPNVIPIGGTVVSKNPKPLPKDMEKFINEGKEGFIFISFGSVAEFVNFDEDVQREFISALKSFPKMRFIWKSTFEINATLPNNILVTKWAPQQTLLGHPKIKAFLTHAGMGSTTEAIHFSVPLICVPIMAEQDLNSEVIASRNAGIKLEIVGLRQHEMEHALTEILHNKKYRNGMTKLTEIFKDRQIPPLENAVWWTEYILRHENTNSFLRSPSVEQTWWVRRNVDVWVVAAVGVLTVIMTSLLTFYLVVRKTIQYLCSQPTSSKKQKMN